MKISVIIPVYNEKNTIREIIRKVNAVNLEKEIIVVDDCSDDGTKMALEDINDIPLKVLFHEKNMGKGKAVRTGLENANCDIVIIQDADLELDPNDYLKLINPIETGEADVVYGSRILNYTWKRSFKTFVANQLLALFTNILYRATFTDVMTCYKIFPTRILRSLNLKSVGFEMETEITAKVAKRKLRILEIPISYYPREFREGKKIKWKNAWKILFTLLIYKFKN